MTSSRALAMARALVVRQAMPLCFMRLANKCALGSIACPFRAYGLGRRSSGTLSIILPNQRFLKSNFNSGDSFKLVGDGSERRCRYGAGTRRWGQRRGHGLGDRTPGATARDRERCDHRGDVARWVPVA